jgi:hypothetical protein
VPAIVKPMERAAESWSGPTELFLSRPSERRTLLMASTMSLIEVSISASSMSTRSPGSGDDGLSSAKSEKS